MAPNLNNDARMNRVSRYEIVTWNSGGLNAKREKGRQRGDFLLSLWDKELSLGVMAVQETHCRSDSELCQSVIDMKARLQVFHSPAGEDDARAGVLLALTHDWEVIESVVGVPGRVLSVRVKSRVFGEKMNFVVVYGKSGGTDGGAWMDGLANVMNDEYVNVILGDFNFVESEEDRRGRAAGLNSYDKALANKFSSTLGGWDLRDLFRETNSDEGGFTYCHDCGWESRIDRIYVNEEFVGKASSFRLKSVLGATAGHKMVWVEIEEGLEIGSGYWKFNVSLLRDKNYANLIRSTWIEAKEDKAEFEDVGLWWDYAKQVLRNVTFDFAKKKKWEERRALRELEREKKRIERDIEEGYGSDVAREQLREIERQLEQEEERKN